MKPYLLHESQELSLELPSNEQQLLQDLHLEPILSAMSRQDPFVYRTMKMLLLNPLTDENAILYRQRILRDILPNPSLIYRLYLIASEIERQSEAYRTLMKPSFSRNVPIREKLMTATDFLPVLLAKLRELRDLGRAMLPSCRSTGLTALFRQLEQTYTDACLADALTHHEHLRQAVGEGRLIIGGKIGNGLKGTGYTLRRIEAVSSLSLNRIRPGRSGSFLLAYNLKEIEESALTNVLRIVRRFIDKTLMFTDLLRFESSFYAGCMQLHEELAKRECETAFPLTLASGERSLSFTGLYDPGMAIRIGRQPFTNDLQADGMRVLMITGANQGGKTTLLRSMGLAQLMMQCGMFVAAASFRAQPCDQIFTHFTREEDETMRSGKLDEELARLDRIVDRLTSRSLLLMNEPFASTTEREGSAIAMDLLAVSHDLSLRVYIVTHFYELASWARGQLKHAVFLSPARPQEGLPSYKLIRQEPTPTSYGDALYREMIGG